MEIGAGPEWEKQEQRRDSHPEQGKGDLAPGPETGRVISKAGHTLHSEEWGSITTDRELGVLRQLVLRSA